MYEKPLDPGSEARQPVDISIKWKINYWSGRLHKCTPKKKGKEEKNTISLIIGKSENGSININSYDS